MSRTWAESEHLATEAGQEPGDGDGAEVALGASDGGVVAVGNGEADLAQAGAAGE